MSYEVKTLYGENRYMNFMETTCPDGKKWVYAKRVNTKGVVIILPLIMDLDEPATIFLKTKRPPLLAEKIAEYNIEFPAGLVADENPNETFDDALKKELLEEVGMVAKEFVIKTDLLSTSAGCVSEISTVAVAKIANSKVVQEPVSDGGVIQERILVRISEIKEFLKNCQNNSWTVGSQTISGIYYLLEELEVF